MFDLQLYFSSLCFVFSCLTVSFEEQEFRIKNLTHSVPIFFRQNARNVGNEEMNQKSHILMKSKYQCALYESCFWYQALRNLPESHKVVFKIECLDC